MARGKFSQDEAAMFALASWALQKRTLWLLRAKGVITMQEGSEVMDGALAFLEAIDLISEGEPIVKARRLLAQTQADWAKSAAPNP